MVIQEPQKVLDSNNNSWSREQAPLGVLTIALWVSPFALTKWPPTRSYKHVSSKAWVVNKTNSSQMEAHVCNNCMIWWYDIWILERSHSFPGEYSSYVWYLLYHTCLAPCIVSLPCFLWCLSSALTGYHSALGTARGFPLLCLCSCPFLGFCEPTHSAHCPVPRLSLLTL